MRLTVCLEGNTEGKVLASINMEEIVKMTITDDIEKSNFNPQMLKSCTDSSYQCGYQQGKKDGIREFAEWLTKSDYANGYFDTENGYVSVDEVLEEYEKQMKGEQNEN